MGVRQKKTKRKHYVVRSLIILVFFPFITLVFICLVQQLTVEIEPSTFRIDPLSYSQLEYHFLL